MNTTITVNIGLTDQLAGFLTKIVSGASIQHGSETTQPAPKPVAAELVKTDPFTTGTAGAQAAEAEPDTSASAVDASPATVAEKPSRKGRSKPTDAGATADPFAAKPTAGAAALGVGDAFSQQVQAAAAEASSEPTFTVKDLNDAAAAAMAKVGAKGVKAILEGNFKAADGSPVDRLSAVQVADYPDAVAKLREAA